MAKIGTQVPIIDRGTWVVRFRRVTWLCWCGGMFSVRADAVPLPIDPEILCANCPECKGTGKRISIDNDISA